MLIGEINSEIDSDIDSGIRIVDSSWFQNWYWNWDILNQSDQDSIEICSVQQAETGRELLYTESWHFEMHVSWCTCWACMNCYTKSATLCWSHITMCWSQYHDVTYENHLLDLKQSASVFCYNYSSLKKNVHVSTVTLQKNSESYFMSIILSIQQLLLNQIISDFSI